MCRAIIHKFEQKRKKKKRKDKANETTCSLFLLCLLGWLIVVGLVMSTIQQTQHVAFKTVLKMTFCLLFCLVKQNCNLSALITSPIGRQSGRFDSIFFERNFRFEIVAKQWHYPLLTRLLPGRLTATALIAQSMDAKAQAQQQQQQQQQKKFFCFTRFVEMSPLLTNAVLMSNRQNRFVLAFIHFGILFKISFTATKSCWNHFAFNFHFWSQFQAYFAFTHLDLFDLAFVRNNVYRPIYFDRTLVEMLFISPAS